MSENQENQAQIIDESQPIESYENSTVVFDDMLLSKQASNIDLFLREDDTVTLIYTTNLKIISISQELLFVIFLISLFYLSKL